MNQIKKRPTIEEIEYAKKLIGFTDNDIFRFVLASEDEQSNEILKTIISCIIKRKVINVQILNTEPPKDKYKEKGVRFDILVECIDQKGETEIVDIEIQKYGKLEYLSTRAQSYKGKLISSQMKEGKDDYELHDTYVVMFVSRSYFIDDRFIHEFCNVDIDSKELLLNNKEHIVFVELDKLKDLDVTRMNQWELLEQIGYLMKYAHDINKCDTINLLIEKHEVLKMMANKKEAYFKDIAEDFGRYKEMLDRYDYEHREEIAVNHGIAIGKEQGIVIGKEQGIAIGKEQGIVIGKEQGIVIGKEQGISIGKTQMKQEMNHQNVLHMYNMGYALEVIADCLSLDVSVVEEIINRETRGVEDDGKQKRTVL